MAYSPTLSIANSKTLRRIAWALDMPMTKTLADIILNTSAMLKKEKICAACQDKSYCKLGCIFYKPIQPAPMTVGKGEGNIKIILEKEDDNNG